MAVKSKDVKLRMLIEAVDRTGRKLSNIQRDVNNLSKSAKELGADSKKAGSEGASGFTKLGKSADETAKRFNKAASQLASFGTQLTALGAAFTAATFFPVASAATFERAMSRVLAVTSGAAENFEELSGKAAELGRTTKFTAAEAAAGMEFLGMAGFSAGQIIEAIGPSLMLAAAGSIELAQAADIASNVLQAMQLPVAELTHITDVLATTAANANTNIIQLSEALKYTAPAAAAVGLPIEQLSAMVGVLASNGIHACYDPETEVLTADGWKKWPDATKDDLFATVNNITHEIEYQQAREMVTYAHKGKMYRVKNRHIDLLVTPNHKLFIEPYYQRGSGYRLQRADQTYGNSVRHLASFDWQGDSPKCIVLDGFEQHRGSWTKQVEPLEIKIEDFVDFLGYYLSEGSCDYDRGSYRIQISQEDGASKDLIRCNLERLPFHFREHTHGFIILNQQLYNYVAQFGKAPHKFIPRKIKSLDKHLLDRLYHSLVVGDGGPNGEYYTSSKQLSDDVQEICLKAGYGVSSVIRFKPGESFYLAQEDRWLTAKYHGYKINVRKNCLTPAYCQTEYRGKHGKRNSGVLWDSKEEWVDYDGIVYCAEVPKYHVLIVRRNGKVLACGNTMAGTSLRGLLIALASPTKQAQDAFDSLGVTIAKQVDGSIDLVKTMEDLGRANMSLSEATAIFRRTSAAAALVLSKQVGIVKELTASNEDSSGAALKMAKTMEENLMGATVLLTSALDGLMRALGAPLMRPLAAAVGMVTSLISFLAELATRFPVISGLLTGIVGTLGVLLLSLGMLFLALAGLLKISASLSVVWAGLNARIIAMGVSAVGTSASMTLLSGAVAMLGAGLKKLWLIMKAHPLILLASAIVGVITALKAFAASSEEAAKKAKEQDRVYSGVISSFDQLKRKYEDAAEGSDKQKIAARELVKYLEKMAEKNANLADAALEAANAIDTETGAIEGAGEALDKFMAKAIEAKMDAITLQAKVLTEQFDEVVEPGRWERFKGLLSTVWEKIGKSEEDAAVLGARKYIESLAVIESRMEIFARRTTAELLALGKLDPALTIEQYMAVMEKWGLAVGKLTGSFRDEWDRRIKLAEAAAEAEISTAGKTTIEIIAELQARYDKESALLKQIKKERDEVRAAAVAAPERTELTEKQIELSADLVAGEEKLGKIQRALADHQIKAATDLRDKQLELLELQKARQEIDTSEAGVKRLQVEAKLTDKVVKIREDLLEAIGKTIGEETGLYEWSAQQKEKAEEKSKRVHAKLRTAEFVYEKKITEQKAALQRRAERDRISLMEEGVGRLEAEMELELKTFEQSTSDRLKKEEEYQEARRAIIEKYEKEIADFRIEKQKEIDEKLAKEREEINEIVAEAEKGAVGASLEARHAYELAQYDEQTQKMLSALIERNASFEEEAQVLMAREQERAALQFEQWQELWNKRLSIAQSALSDIGSMFQDLYEMSGKQSKAYFRIAKAAALAEAIISGARAVINALGTQPYYVGVMMAALAAAKVGVQIAKIRSTEMQTGGPVVGGSGKKDDVPILATAGEYMHPVSAVQYYGKNIMEALRRRMIPRELFGLADLPVLSAFSPRGGFQTGGVVSSEERGAMRGRAEAAPSAEERAINIVNVVDSSMLDQYMATQAGQQSVLNVLAENSLDAKRILSE